MKTGKKIEVRFNEGACFTIAPQQGIVDRIRDSECS
jgi:hypothetical protein